MKIRGLLVVGLGFVVMFGLSGCDKDRGGSQANAAVPASIAPVASVAIDSTATAFAAAAASNPAPGGYMKVAATVGANVPNQLGEKVFSTVCFMCHQTGAAGAPVFGNKDDWAPRIAKGKPTLYKHALEGFTGNKGTMPPRGGNPGLKDDEVRAAVDFMVSKAQ
jgi:cytochrome c5